MKQIAMYLRLSLSDLDLGESGKEESNSIENQRLLIRNYIEAHTELIGPVVEYKDDGYSGLNFNRPAFKQMIEDAKKGFVGTIIVKDLSRFGRDYIGVGDYMEQILPSLGVRLIAINSRYDSADQGANILSMDVSISNMINNMYSKDISKKIKSIFKAKWNDGLNPSGVVPFGYCLEPGDKEHKMLIDEDAAKTVRLIFDMAIKGKNSKQIAEHLNREGIPTPMIYRYQNKGFAIPDRLKWNLEEQLWNTHKVLNVIKNLEYTGTRVHGKHESVGVGLGKRKLVEKRDWHITENHHEPIVTQGEFEIAQLIIQRHKDAINSSDRKDAFSKKFRCGCCGNILQIIDERDGYLYCQHASDVGMKSQCCRDRYSKNLLVGKVKYALKTQIDLMGEISVKLKDKLQSLYPDANLSLEKMRNEILNLNDELARNYENYVSGNMERERFIEFKKKVNTLRNELEDKITAIESDKDNQERTLFEINRQIQLGQGLLGKDKASVGLVNALIEEIIIYDSSRIEIKFRFADLIKEAQNTVAL